MRRLRPLALILSLLLAALIAVGVDALLTGMLHLDGLADSGDGLVPPLPRARRLAVMADPAVGAFGLASVLAAYAPQLVLSSPSVRCTDSVLPYSQAAGVEVTTRKGLSEEGFAADAGKSDKHLAKVLALGEPAALCTHGPVLPTVLAELTRRTPKGRERTMLSRLARAAALTQAAGSARLAIESLTEMGEATGSRMTTVIQGGVSSVTALTGSTEEAQFYATKAA